MATMNISLPDQMREWVEAQLDTGKYASSSDYVRDLIRQHQSHLEQVQILQGAITEGFESGEPEDFNADDFKKEMKARYVAE